MPARGFDIRMAAMPHVAMAQDGSCASTSPNAFSVSAYRNECSIATARWKRSCTAGLHEFWKSTLPSWSLDCAWMSAGTTSIRATSDIASERCVFIVPPVQFDRASASAGPGEHLRRLLLDHRTLEEVRVHLAPEAHGVREHEIAEVVVGEQLVLDQLVGLGQDLGHVGDVHVTDVRAEERVEARVHRVRLAVEGPRVDGIVGLAAEVEARDEQLADVLFARDLAPGVVVEVLDAAGAVAVVVEPLAAAHRLHHRGLAVLLDQREYARLIEPRGVGVLERLAISLLPVADEIGVERAGPAHAAFQEGEVQLREAPRDAAEEESLGHGLASGSEVADLAVAEVRRRVAEQDRARAVVEARRDAQLAALLPHRVVVVLAVDADRVVPLDELRRLGMLLLKRGDRAADEAAHHDDAEAELLAGELHLLDGLVRREHRDDGGRNDAVAARAELLVA